MLRTFKSINDVEYSIKYRGRTIYLSLSAMDFLWGAGIQRNPTGTRILVSSRKRIGWRQLAHQRKGLFLSPDAGRLIGLCSKELRRLFGRVPKNLYVQVVVPR